jgi:hypothetical protein
VGNATLWLFPADGTYGSYTLTAVPPAGTPFSTFNVQNVLVTSDKSIVVVLQFEHAPPITTMSLSPAPDAAGLYPDPVTVTLSATAAAGFAIQATYYKVDNGPTQTYTGPFQVSGDGSHTLQYWSVDDGGVFELPNTTTFEIQSVAIVGTSPGHAWVGLKNSDDQGTWFDIRAELYVNGVQVSEGLTRCVTGITRNPSLAKDVAVPFGPVTGGDLSSGDVVSVKFSTRIGTKPDGTKCGGHNNAVGLRLYFDAVSRPSRAGLHISPDPLTDNFLRSPGSGLYLDLAAPTGATPKQQDSGPINFAGGNPWAAIGTWSRVMP